MHERVVYPRRIASYVRRGKLLARVLLTITDLRFRRKLIPLHRVVWLRKMFKGSNVLEPHPSVYVRSGFFLNNKVLARRLAHMEMGMWTLGVDTLNYIERLIKITKPEVILEFGSGISTLCLCQYMYDLHGETGKTRVFSIDQEERYVLESGMRVAQFGFDTLARLAYCPSIPQRIEGIKTECYDISHRFLTQFLHDCMPGLVLIDGPAGREGVRFGTLPLIKHVLPTGTIFVLDDALRDSELKTSLQWDSLPYLNIMGLKVISKGVLLGEVVYT